MKILLAEDDGAGNVFAPGGKRPITIPPTAGATTGPATGTDPSKKARGSAVPTTAKEREGGCPGGRRIGVCPPGLF